MADQDFISDDQFVPDAAKPSNPDFIPDEQFKPDAAPQSAAAADAPDFIPDHEFQDDQDKYTTPLQQAGTVAEGFARGIAPGAATYAENKLSQMGVPGISPQEQLGRQTANPGEAATGEIGGNVALMGLAPELEFAKLGQVGSKAINGMIQMGLISGGDEVSKSLLGQGDPASSVAAHIAGAGALGLIGGGLFGKAENAAKKGLQALENSKLGAKLTGFLSGFGHAATFPGQEAVSLGKSALTSAETGKLDPTAFKAGQKAYNDITGKAAGQVAKYVADYAGYKIGGLPGMLAGHVVGQHLEKLVNKTIPSVAQKYIAPSLLRAASSGSVEGLGQVLDHATTLGKGVQKTAKLVDSIFNASANKGIEAYQSSEKDRDKLNSYIEGGGSDQDIRDAAQQDGVPSQNYAEGGEVKVPEKNHIAEVFPEQNVLLSAAKGRMSNYLSSIRPVQSKTKLPYDSEMENSQKKKDYHKALDIAVSPLSVVDKIKKGTLLPKDVTHLTSMYPELHQELSKKITERMHEGQLKEEKKPPYHVRQALSLFLGASLDSTLTPAGIMASQNVFAQQSAQKQAQSSQAALGKIGQNSMTPEQSRSQRQNKP